MAEYQDIFRRTFRKFITFLAGLRVVGTATIEGDLVPTALVPAAATKLTIASGVVTLSQMAHTIETEGGASSDDLTTINGLADGEIAVISPFSASHDVVLKHGAVNIECPGAADVTLAEIDDCAVVRRIGSKVAVLAVKLKATGLGGSVGAGGIGTTELADGAVTEDKLGAGAVTTNKVGAAAVTGPKIASSFIQPFAIVGLDLDGGSETNIPCTGAQVGDVVAFMAKVTGVGPIVLGNDDFEATITTAGQIKQTSLTDLDGVQYFGFLLKRN